VAWSKLQTLEKIESDLPLRTNREIFLPRIFTPCMRYAVKVSLKWHAYSLLSRFHIFMKDEQNAESRGISTYKQTVIEAEHLPEATPETKYVLWMYRWWSLNTVIWDDRFLWAALCVSGRFEAKYANCKEDEYKHRIY